MDQFAPYQPAMPAGHDPSRPLPRPARPVLFGRLAWAGGFVVLLGAALLTIAIIEHVTGPVGAVTGAILAAVPVVPVVMTYLWLDRYEAEPTRLLALALAWGAGVATLGALAINTESTRALQLAGGSPTAAAVFVAPVVEESLKGAAVLLVLLVRRREFDGVLDGIVYAGMAGVGFAYVENVLYLGRTLASQGPEGGTAGLIVTFVVRCVVSPFAHPLFTAATGIGVGLAVRSRSPLVKVLAPMAGWAVAVVLHGAWNATAASGLSGFVLVYATFQLPVFLAFAALALSARAREGRLIRRHLAGYAGSGWLHPGELEMLGSLPARREARDWAARTGGAPARRAMRDFQELGSELAFLRERMSRGTAQDDAQLRELDLLAAMSAARAGFVPRWAGQ